VVVGRSGAGLLCFVELCCDDLSLRSAVWYMYSSSRRRHRHRVANPEAVDRRAWESLFSGTRSSAQTRTMPTPPTAKTARFHSAGLINFPKPFEAAFQGVTLGMVAASGKRSGVLLDRRGDDPMVSPGSSVDGGRQRAMR